MLHSAWHDEDGFALARTWIEEWCYENTTHNIALCPSEVHFEIPKCCRQEDKIALHGYETFVPYYFTPTIATPDIMAPDRALVKRLSHQLWSRPQNLGIAPSLMTFNLLMLQRPYGHCAYIIMDRFWATQDPCDKCDKVRKNLTHTTAVKIAPAKPISVHVNAPEQMADGVKPGSLVHTYMNCHKP